MRDWVADDDGLIVIFCRMHVVPSLCDDDDDDLGRESWAAAGGVTRSQSFSSEVWYFGILRDEMRVFFFLADGMCVG